MTAKATYETALAARRSGDLIRARLLLEQALQQKLEGTLLGEARATYATVLLRLGDVRAALEGFEEFVAGGDAYPDLLPVVRPHLLYNRGLALRQLSCRNGQEDAEGLRAAYREYLSAADECRREGLYELLRKSLQNAAWVCCLLGDPDQAEAALGESEGLCRTAEAVAHQRVGQAFLTAAKGDYVGAMEESDRIVHDTALPAEVRAQAFWLAGRISLQHGRTAEAESFALQAIELATGIKTEQRVLNDSANLLRLVRLQATNNEGVSA